MAPPKPHPGIRIGSISVEGAIGLAFTIGVMSIFLLGLSAVRWFLALSLPLGILVGAVLYFLHRRRA
jgi:hypothetical protein